MPRYAEMPKLRELYARLVTRGARVRFVYHPPGEPVGLRRIYMYDREGYDVGTLVWQVCDACRHGSINKVSITLEYQRQGFGRRLILRALSNGPGYNWTTSGQSPDAQQFFPVMTAETGATFAERGPACRHIRDHRNRPNAPSAVRRLRLPKPFVERNV